MLSLYNYEETNTYNTIHYVLVLLSMIISELITVTAPIRSLPAFVVFTIDSCQNDKYHIDLIFSFAQEETVTVTCRSQCNVKLGGMFYMIE